MTPHDTSQAALASLDEYALTPLCHNGITAPSRGLHVEDGSTLLVGMRRPYSPRARPCAGSTMNSASSPCCARPGRWCRAPACSTGARVALVYDDTDAAPLASLPPAPAGDLAAVHSRRVPASAARRARGRPDPQGDHALGPDRRRGGRCRLTRFGLAAAQQWDIADALPPHTLAGGEGWPICPRTPAAPRHGLDARSDLYSLGVVLYRLATGQLPFAARDPADVNEWIHAHGQRSQPPHRLAAAVPEALSLLIMKLLDKRPSRRYRSAAGLEADIRGAAGPRGARSGRIDVFELGRRDQPAELELPDRLHARDADLRELAEAYAHVALTGQHALVTVSGPSGIGKSALMRAFIDSLRQQQVCCAVGKADQFRHDAPYAAIAEAFHGLVIEHPRPARRPRAPLAGARQPRPGPVCAPSRCGHRTRARGADRPAARPATGQRRRYGRAFRSGDAQYKKGASSWRVRAAGTPAGPGDRGPSVARPRRPGRCWPACWTAPRRCRCCWWAARGRWAMHWVRAVDLDPRPQDRHLALQPLDVEAVGTVLAETLRARRATSSRWRGWSTRKPSAIRSSSASSSRPWSMTGSSPTRPTREAGSTTSSALRSTTLHGQRRRYGAPAPGAAAAAHAPVARRHGMPGPAVGGGAGLRGVRGGGARAARPAAPRRVPPTPSACKEPNYVFSHDRVQEAAHGLLTPEERDRVHLRVGRLLRDAPDTSAGNSARRHRVPGHRVAGAGGGADHRCRGSHPVRAAEPGRGHARTARHRLSGRAGRRHRRPGLRAHCARARTCRCRRGGIRAAARALRVPAPARQAAGEALTLAETLLEAEAPARQLAEVYRLKTELHTRRSENALAVETAIQGLRMFGISLSAHPSAADADAAYRAIAAWLDRHGLAALAHLPQMSDPDVKAAMALLAALSVPASFVDEHLVFLELCEMMWLTLAHGISGPSTAALGWLSACWSATRFAAYEDGFRYGEMARNWSRGMATLRMRPARCCRSTSSACGRSRWATRPTAPARASRPASPTAT